jgi:mono/diheme cytochrome c family protein
MKSRLFLFSILILAAGLSALPGLVSAQQSSQQETKVASANDPAPAAPATTGAAASAHSAPAKLQDEDALRIEGEKRFHANCGRCHQAPHKFPPRMMATIVRHMRVRATITDEDMRVILHYMTQ